MIYTEFQIIFFFPKFNRDTDSDHRCGFGSEICCNLRITLNKDKDMVLILDIDQR